MSSVIAPIPRIAKRTINDQPLRALPSDRITYREQTQPQPAIINRANQQQRNALIWGFLVISLSVAAATAWLKMTPLQSIIVSAKEVHPQNRQAADLLYKRFEKDLQEVRTEQALLLKQLATSGRAGGQTGDNKIHLANYKNPQDGLRGQQRLATRHARMPQTKKSLYNGPAIDFGNYYALVVGNNKYANLADLKTPENDARTIANILKSKYGFKTTVLLNANRYMLLSALNEMREKLTEKDNLLIYYAGHGELDPVNLRGYWLPVDAESDNSANWISNIEITDLLNAMTAKHVLVVADSCYSGSLTRSSVTRLRAGMSDEARIKWYRVISSARTRAVLTSGDVKPVLDAGGGDHSVFAKAFLDALRSKEQILEGYELYRAIQKRMKKATARLNVDQNPQYAPINYAGHEAGEFLFLPSPDYDNAENLPALAAL